MHVIVVGAGPSGLALNLVLARAGIEVTLIERDSMPSEQPRAAHHLVPAIQIFRRAGILDEVRRAGFIPKHSSFRKLDGTPILTMEGLGVPEGPDATTVLPTGPLGKLMVRHAERNDKITLKWGHSVTSVGQDENSAWADVKKQDGTEERIVGDYLCGCDGGTSRVRKSLFGARNFPGKTWDKVFVSTNVYYPFDRYGYTDVNTILDPQHPHIVGRLTTDGLWRVSYQVDASLTHEEILKNQPAHYERILPGHPKPGDYTLTNISPYRLHQRCAERFCVGRVCLAADAAHLCNPWGGLGLTGGFADVAGLADCLEGIASGRADANILDRYDEVRRGIYHSVIDPVSTANLLRGSTVDPDTAVESDAFLALCAAAEHDPIAAEKIKMSIYGLCHDFTQYYSVKA